MRYNCVQCVYHTSCMDYHSYSDLVSGFPYPLASLDDFFANHLQSSTLTIVTSLVEDGWRRKFKGMKMMLLLGSSKIQIAITIIACAESVALNNHVFHDTNGGIQSRVMNH